MVNKVNSISMEVSLWEKVDKFCQVTSINRSKLLTIAVLEYLSKFENRDEEVVNQSEKQQI